MFSIIRALTPARLGLLIRAKRACDARQWKLARDLFANYLARVPGHAAIWVQLGHAAKESGDFREAYAAYQRSLALQPDVAETHLQIGHLLKQMRDRPGAVASFRRALELDGRLFDAQRELQMLEPTSRPHEPRATSFAEAASARLLDPAPRLLLDLSDVFVYLRRNATVSGIQRVQLGLAEAFLSAAPGQAVFLTEADGDGGYIEIDAAHLGRLIAELKKPRVSRAGLDSVLAAARRHAAWYKCRKGDVIVVLGAFWVLPTIIERVADLQAQGAVIGLLIHDIIPITHPEFFTGLLADSLPVLLAGMLQVSDFILTVSDHSGRAVRRFAERQGIASPPIMTLRPAHKTWETPPSALPRSKAMASIMAEPYVLCVSTLEARKNHLFLFHIWKMLRDAGDVAVPLLVLVGKQGEGVHDLMAQLAATGGLQGRIRLIHGVSDAELAELYRHAWFTVFPSFEEGWGLPVGESLMFGRPCIASNASSIPEVGGALVDYVDPFNATVGYQVIRRFITDADHRERRAAQIRRDFAPRLWGEVAHELAGLVAKVTQERP